MESDVDTHSHSSDELMKIINYITEHPDDPTLQYSISRLPPHQINQIQHVLAQREQQRQSQQVQQQQQQQAQHIAQQAHHQQQVKLESYSQMNPNQMQNVQQGGNNMFYNQSPSQGGYYNQNVASVNFPQSPVPSSPHHGSSLPLHMASPSPQTPNSPGGPLDTQFNMQNTADILNEFQNLNTLTLLKKIYQLQRSQKEDLNKIRQIQKQVMCNPQKQTFDLLDNQHRQLKEHIECEVKALQRLYTQVILLPAEIHKLLLLVQELKIQQTQLELYHQELHQLAQAHGPTRCIATLVVSSEPFPMVITKGKQLDDDPVVVQLLSGANVEFQSFSQMKVAMVWENHQSKGNNQKNIDCDTQLVDAFNRVAKWHLKFLNGTRKNSVTLRFGMQVQVSQPNGSVTVTVESHSTRPFIVITNECQWEESEGTLLKKDSFGEQAEIPWAQFANVLQRHFLRATRQDAVSPTRSLCQTDFEYIHMKFFNSSPTITPKAYSSFWSWFGKTIKKLRYQRHILPLWQLGLIHGFLSREAVQEVLNSQDPGTFLVRFSERHAGQFAVAYRIDGQTGERVRHYLVQPDDTAGNKKTLPDFLSEQTPFCYLLQIGTEDENGVKVYHKFKKENVLETYLSKRNTLPPAVGYDSNIIAYQSPMIEMDKELIDAE